jgi:8-oxo-dGTP diphosphatase
MADGHKHPRVGVANVLTFNNFVLIGKRKGEHAGGMYGFPGGHLELFESFEECAIRETLEETGMVIPPHIPKVWTVENTMFKEEHRHFATIFVVTPWTPDMGTAVVTEPDKNEGWKWCWWFDLPQPLMPGIQQLLNKDKRPPGIMEMHG